MALKIKETYSDPDIDIFMEKTLDKLSKSVDLKMLAERIAERKVISPEEAKIIILKKFGDYASETIAKKRSRA